MELVVVVAGLAILSSLSIPNILGRIKLNRVEEAKALMNSYFDCLGKYRISTDASNFIKNAPPMNWIMYDFQPCSIRLMEIKINVHMLQSNL